MRQALRKSGYTIAITLPKSIVQKADHYARNAMIGGRSNIRVTNERMDRLYEDQMTGQLCHAAVSDYLFASFDPWIQQRQEADANPTRGDGGTDFVGWPLDVKGSKMRGSEMPDDYHLIVRPAELHDSVWYVHALVAKNANDLVYLTGIARGYTIRQTEVMTSGPFRGAYAIKTWNLSAIELIWAVEKTVDTMTSQTLSV